MFADNEKFLELDLSSVAKICGSNQLLIESEIQVFYALDSWLKFDLAERKKYATYLFTKTRISLLSNHALQHMMKKKSCFNDIIECTEIVEKVLEEKTISKSFKSTAIRFCHQDNFDVIVAGGFNRKDWQVFDDVCSLKGVCFDKEIQLSKMSTKRQKFKMVYIKGNVYALGGLDSRMNEIMSVEKYSIAHNKWETIASMYDHGVNFSLCSFLQDVYVIGGQLKQTITNTCVKFNTFNRKWTKLTGPKNARCYAACTVFEGKVVVSGGMNNFETDAILNTVETYDPFGDLWTNLPNMIYPHCLHKTVAVKNRLFVLGGFRIPSASACEMFDSHSNRFVLLKPSPFAQSCISYSAEVVFFGRKLAVFGPKKKMVAFYDVDSNKWSKEGCEVPGSTIKYSCVLVPRFQL